MKTLLVTLIMISWANAQDITIDKSDEFTLTETGLITKSNKDDLIINIDNLISISCPDPRDNNQYITFQFSNHNVRVKQRVITFESLQLNKKINLFIDIPNLKNRIEKLLINKEKVISVQISKSTQEKAIGTILLDGIEKPLVVESFIENLGLLSKKM